MVVTLLLLKRVFMGNTLLLPPCRSNADDIAKSIQEFGGIPAVAQALWDQMQDNDASLQVCAASGPRLACARRCNKNTQTAVHSGLHALLRTTSCATCAGVALQEYGQSLLQRTDELQEHHRVQQALVEARQVSLQAAAQSGSCVQQPSCTGATSPGL